MPTLRAAAALLSAAHSIDALAPIATAIGCAGEPAPLDANTRTSFGIDDAIVAAHVAAGPGALRALMIDVAPGRPLREVLSNLAGRLTTRAPHVLWIVLATQSTAHEIAIAAWAGDRRPPRIAALVADRIHLVDSDAETVRALAAVMESAGDTPRDILVHSRWVEVLGREALTIRFYRALDHCVSDIAASSSVGSDETRAELALLNVSRLLFLAFLEAKGWLDRDVSFLMNRFERASKSGGHFHDRVLRPLFFGTLNTPVKRRAKAAKAFGSIPFLNGGLFSRTPLERRHRGLSFSDDAYGALLYDVFGHFRFTAREEASTWTEAAVDPEMLGRAFESLMASRERQRTGAFYTPFSLVERVSERGIDSLTLVDRASIERLHVLDPACGSGAFLVYSLERLARILINFGDPRDVSTVRREVLTRSIFGVDINPTAVWLCELRLWLSVIIESEERDPMKIAPLPNLDRNIRVGDALATSLGESTKRVANPTQTLRQRYARATGARKKSLGRALDRSERVRALRAIETALESITAKRHDLLGARRGRDLFGDAYAPGVAERRAAITLRRRAAELRASRKRILGGGALPFSFGVHFADVVARGGFSLIVGNPPWVRLHRIPPEQRLAFRQDFFVARHAAWENGASAAGAGRGFAAQVDTAALFIERSVRLLAPNGSVALLVPAKLWRSLAGGGVRQLLSTDVLVRCIEDYSEAPVAFDAAVYPSLVVASRCTAGVDVGNDVAFTHPTNQTAKPDIDDERTSNIGAEMCVAVHHRGNNPYSWRASRTSLALNKSAGAPWLLLPPDARRAFDWLVARGRPLAASVMGRPHLGVKCGCNDAFLVEVVRTNGEIAEVRTSEGKTIKIERSILRPLIRGEAARPWRVPDSADAIIWTHGEFGAPLQSLPPLAARWLSRWRRVLSQRTDARSESRWWSLFRTEAARYDIPRVVWGDVGRAPRAFVLEAGDPRVPLNTCYAVRCRDATDAHALAALLNGPLAHAWLNALAEPARGGYRRYMGWTLSLLPIPCDWTNARDSLAALSRRARSGEPPSASEAFDTARAAYGARHDDVAPLVAWGAR